MKEVDDAVRVAIASAATLGESPFWHTGEQALYYADIVGRRLQRFDPKDGELRHWDFDSDVASLAPCLDGSLLIAMRDGIWRFDPTSGERARLVGPPYDPARERFNDGKCDPQGRFWVGTVYEPRDPALGSLHCYARGTLTREFGGVTTLNGLAWSPDGRTMHWSDTRIATVFAADFDPASGTLSRQRVFKAFPPKVTGQDLDTYGGRPDGAAMDVEGCYWVAMFEGQRVVRLSPEGELLREIVLPARCPTMPCFGGPDLRTLYITTSRENRPAAELIEQPYAGCVFAIDLEVQGLPVNFAL
ncbi:MAG: SMP-30/gluconolactonase/LRE family protein [Pseudomonadota bacterium]|nr:SMP-30/gluconolactonase/LRE family protein [Pseudomonadota bacterium]